jgi:hypothetical protein
MPQGGTLKRYIAQAVRSADTVFESLVFLGSLRDAYTGRYLHEGLSGTASAEEIHRTLREFHRSNFEAVLSLPLIDLSKQLRFHFRKVEEPERETSLLWLEAEPFRDLIPQACSPVLRDLFVSKVKTALEVLCRDPDWPELKESIASPHSQPGQLLLLPWIN